MHRATSHGSVVPTPLFHPLPDICSECIRGGGSVTGNTNAEPLDEGDTPNANNSA
ncbi:MAG: hypothetical protein ACJARS_004417, partial [bacterium]